MAIGSILVPISGGTGSPSALEAALQVGHQFGAYVEVLHARIDPNQAVPVLAEGMTGTLVAEMIQTLEEGAEIRASSAREFFDERCGSDAVPVAGSDSMPPGRNTVAARPLVIR